MTARAAGAVPVAVLSRAPRRAPTRGATAGEPRRRGVLGRPAQQGPQQLVEAAMSIGLVM